MALPLSLLAQIVRLSDIPLGGRRRCPESDVSNLYLEPLGASRGGQSRAQINTIARRHTSSAPSREFSSASTMTVGRASPANAAAPRPGVFAEVHVAQVIICMFERMSGGLEMDTDCDEHWDRNVDSGAARAGEGRTGRLDIGMASRTARLASFIRTGIATGARWSPESDPVT